MKVDPPRPPAVVVLQPARDALAIRHSRLLTQRVIPLALAAYLATVGLFGRPGMFTSQSRWVMVAGFSSAAVALLVRAAYPTARTMIWSTAVVLVMALARTLSICTMDLGYLVGDRIVGVAAWSFLSILAINLGLTGIASVILQHDVLPPLAP